MTDKEKGKALTVLPTMNECPELLKLRTTGAVSDRCKLCLEAEDQLALGVAIPNGVSVSFKDKLEEFGFTFGRLFMRYPGFRSMTIPQGWSVAWNEEFDAYDFCNEAGQRRVRIYTCDGDRQQYSVRILSRYESVVRKNASNPGSGMLTGVLIDNSIGEEVHTTNRRIVGNDTFFTSRALQSVLGDEAKKHHPRPFDNGRSWLPREVVAAM